MDDKYNIVTMQKIPLTERLCLSAIALFGGIFAGVAMIFVTPFAALKIFFTSKRNSVDFDKLKALVDEAAKDIDVYKAQSPQDLREPWKRAHDDEFGAQ